MGLGEVLGLAIGASEAETFWMVFLRKLARRGLRGVKLVISNAHDTIKAAVSKVLNASWQRCRVELLKNPLSRDSLLLTANEECGNLGSRGGERFEFFVVSLRELGSGLNSSTKLWRRR